MSMLEDRSSYINVSESAQDTDGRKVNPTHAYYNGSRTSQDIEDPSWSTSIKTKRQRRHLQHWKRLGCHYIMLYLYFLGTFALDTTPYEVIYGQAPPMHIPYVAKESKTVQWKLWIENFAGKGTSGANTQLQPYRQLTVRQGIQHKLSSKFFDPFQVVGKIGKVAYKLQLPSYAKVHPVFHVFQLKPCYTEFATMGSFPLCDDESLLVATPLRLLERKMVKQNNRMVVFGLIQWIVRRMPLGRSWKTY
ncbi:hypothetical protein Tco_1237519 [Tanacetum coccineum]